MCIGHWEDWPPTTDIRQWLVDKTRCSYHIVDRGVEHPWWMINWVAWHRDHPKWTLGQRRRWVEHPWWTINWVAWHRDHPKWTLGQRNIWALVHLEELESAESWERKITYEERLKECGLTTLETRRLRGDQIEVFKILNGYENIDSNIFFEIKESKITRGHNYTLVKKQSRLDVRKFSFSQRTINIWNNLSTDCVHASSVNMFKNKIDKYLVKAGYT